MKSIKVRRPGSPIAGLKPLYAAFIGVLRGVRRPGSPIAGLKQHGHLDTSQVNRSQKAWKLDCGIETYIIFARRKTAQHSQKAWKPDCGIETGVILARHYDKAMSEGLEARLRD